MLTFITSLPFLYLFAIVLLFIYGARVYRSITRKGYRRGSFALVFLLIFLACISFLYFNIHSPLHRKSFSNLDHHFIRHDGFRTAGSLELGISDTAGQQRKAFNRFRFRRDKGQLTLESVYSEEPFYISAGGRTKLVSRAFPAEGHTVRIKSGQNVISLFARKDDSYELRINGRTGGITRRPLKRGQDAWQLFRDDTLLLNSGWLGNEKLNGCLSGIFILRDDFSGNGGGALRFFFSGRLFRFADSVQYDNKYVSPADLSFSTPLADGALTGWGVGFPEKGRQQYFVYGLGQDSFRLANRYPVSFPLTEEPSTGDQWEWGRHDVVKFLLADPGQIAELPAVFNEGYLFSGVTGDSGLFFRPLLLSYQKDKAHTPLMVGAQFAGSGETVRLTVNGKFYLPAVSGNHEWEFSVVNSFYWQFGVFQLKPADWQWLIFGSLGFFFLLVFFTALVKPAGRFEWVWQLLSCLVLLLLSTRFFLYWRYKSFPPYEQLDTASIQQLNNVWNFGIIIIATLLLALIFGGGLFRQLFRFLARHTRKFTGAAARPQIPDLFYQWKKFTNRVRIGLATGSNSEKTFWGGWALLLCAGGGLVVATGYDASVCRHLAIALIFFYFAFTYISYRFSPLVAAGEKSWWTLSTSGSPDLFISNPVKFLLSLSLLGLYSFIDIGFALLFINFLLFNEAYLSINYSIAGLSSGSRGNASRFGIMALLYLALFVINLIYGPYLFAALLEMPAAVYTLLCLAVAILVALAVGRLSLFNTRKKRIAVPVTGAVVFAATFLLFPKERIQEKAAMTKYRIDVLVAPADEVIRKAYENGDSYEPVIRAAQNQWFINTFISGGHNPAVNGTGFQLLPHAPQNRGAKYNAQATDLVTSRFLIAEHGKWAVLLFALLLLLPVTLLASFYKLYPDFTNRVNPGYPAVTTGFSILNYIFVSGLLVILAATGRYIFFGQDLPFGSILSKQSILFPSLLLVAVILLFRKIPIQQYPNPRKWVPGTVVFTGLALLLLFVKPAFNNNREFGVAELARDLDGFIQQRIQPLLLGIDTAQSTRRLPAARKDLLLSQRIRELTESGAFHDAGAFTLSQLTRYSQSGFTQHINPNNMLYLDLHEGNPRLAVNENYFHVEPPPHLQQLWRGNVFGDSSSYQITLWDARKGRAETFTTGNYTIQRQYRFSPGIELAFRKKVSENLYEDLCLVNHTGSVLDLTTISGRTRLAINDSLSLPNPGRIHISGPGPSSLILQVEPEAFMKNYFVNGSRYYYYPLGNNLVWARNFAESIAADFSGPSARDKNVFISMDAGLTDSLSARIRKMLSSDTAYKTGAEYAICIADGNGRLLAIPDHIKGRERPDPNDKPAFLEAVGGLNEFLPPSELRRRTGNINLMRLNPGPGSTLKPIVFSAIASQLDLDWDAFAAEGFSGKQDQFGGEKVGEYDFEQNNGRITSVSDYIRYSDNYYNSNLLLLGSYSRQNLEALLLKHFIRERPVGPAQWPWFSYKGQPYFLSGFENWPGYAAGRANFGSDSSFVSIGLRRNYGIHTWRNGAGFDRFPAEYDSALFKNAGHRSGFILPEYALFDQKGGGMNLDRPNEVFLSSFRGHVKGSSQVMIPPVKMLDAYGKLVSQNRDYSLTLNPGAGEKRFVPASVGDGVSYSHYLSLMRGSVFTGMKEALFRGTAARLGARLKNGSPWYYYAKTGTTGDETSKSKSKLFTIVISEKDIADPGFNFRRNRFVVIYFTSQNGPAMQNEEFQAEIIKLVERSPVFLRYMQAPQKPF